jgi:hypothetical protein
MDLQFDDQLKFSCSRLCTETRKDALPSAGSTSATYATSSVVSYKSDSTACWCSVLHRARRPSAPTHTFSSPHLKYTMPTPESEAFKAKKPTVPPTFDGVDFRNNQQVWDARDAIIREQWVKQMMARLVREELGKVTFSFGGVMCGGCRFGAGEVSSVVSQSASTGDE